MQILVRRAGITEQFAGFIFPITLAVLNGALPTIVKFLVKNVEKWPATIQVQQLIGRGYIIKLLNLGITIMAPYTNDQPDKIKALYDEGGYGEVGSTEALNDAFYGLCVEDHMGALLWKLCITDMVTQFIVNAVVLNFLYYNKKKGNQKPKKLKKYRHEIKVEAMCSEVNRMLEELILTQSNLDEAKALKKLQFNFKKDKKKILKDVQKFLDSTDIEKEPIDQPQLNTDEKDPNEFRVPDAANKYMVYIGAVAGDEHQRASGAASGHGEGRGGTDSDDEPDGDSDDGESRPDTASSRPSTASEEKVKVDYNKMARDRAVNDAKKEYDVPPNIINLMYQQCLIFVGFSFAPMLFALGLLGYLVTFWVQYYVLMIRSKAPESADVKATYYKFLAATIVYSSVVLSGLWLIRSGNQFCGPFSQSSGAVIDFDTSIYRTFHYYCINYPVQFFVDTYKQIVYYIFSAIFMCFFCGICCISCMFYERHGLQQSRIVNKANRQIGMLELERQETMVKLSAWCHRENTSIPGLIDEKTAFLQDTDMVQTMDENLRAEEGIDESEVDERIMQRMYECPVVTGEKAATFTDPEQFGRIGHTGSDGEKLAGIPVDTASDFFMWRTGRAKPKDGFEKEEMEYRFPYNTIEVDTGDEDHSLGSQIQAQL